MIVRLSLALLRIIAHLPPRRDREAWLQEWESEIQHLRSRAAAG